MEPGLPKENFSRLVVWSCCGHGISHRNSTDTTSSWTHDISIWHWLPLVVLIQNCKQKHLVWEAPLLISQFVHPQFLLSHALPMTCEWGREWKWHRFAFEHHFKAYYIKSEVCYSCIICPMFSQCIQYFQQRSAGYLSHQMILCFVWPSELSLRLHQHHCSSIEQSWI